MWSDIAALFSQTCKDREEFDKIIRQNLFEGSNESIGKLLTLRAPEKR